MQFLRVKRSADNTMKRKRSGIFGSRYCGSLDRFDQPGRLSKKLRKRDSELGFYLGTNCLQVEMLSNGKKRKILAGNVKDIFRLIQPVVHYHPKHV